VNAFEAIADQRVVPVIRCGDVDDAVSTARAAAAAGMRVVELTLTTPGVHAAIRELDDLVVGLGTVMSASDVGPAVDAGAAFVVSFGNPPHFLDAAREAGVPALPGVLTPGEALAAGTDVMKLFPARLVSPAYLRDLAAVMPSARFVPTGGIETADVGAWLAAGAFAVGLGGSLGTAARVGADEVEARCRAALAAVVG
jgi:2-dehydro-3-deoxyphosphogluconate aldolase/(4S)-4-hydroxy-2-oxoglutarate aldolase